VTLTEVVALTLLLIGSLLVLRAVVASDVVDALPARPKERSPQGQPAPTDLRRAA